MRLNWSRLAAADRKAIFDHIERENPRAAIFTDDRIRSQLKRLLVFPEIGRPGRVPGTRELVVSRTPYIAAYVIVGDTIRILRILHGAQLWPTTLS